MSTQVKAKKHAFTALEFCGTQGQSPDLLTDAINAFRGTPGIKIVQCRPGDPEAKGLVERVNGYLETSLLPGRTFISPNDFNAQLGDWLDKANQRQHRRLGCWPIDRWAADRIAMLELPPVDPVVGWRLSTRLPPDHYVRLDSNDYSVHPSIGLSIRACKPFGRWGEVFGDDIVAAA